MAVRETLDLSLDQALRQVSTLEKNIDELRKPVVIPVDLGNANRDIGMMDERLRGTEEAAKGINRELAEVSGTAGRAVVDFSRMASELGISESQARDLAREILESRSAANRVADAAADVAHQLDASEDEARRFASSMQRAAGETREVAAATSRASGSVSALGAGLKGLAVGAAASIGIREIARFAAESIKLASDLEESTSKANVVFGDFAGTIFDFTERAPSELGSTRAAAIEMAASFGNLFSSVGLDQRAAAEMSTTLVQLGTDLASFNNLTVDESLEKLRSGLVGQAEPLRSVGVLLSEAAVSAKGLELGLGGATGKLSEAEKVQARYAIILEQTVTAQGDFARTADGVANSQKSVTAAFQEFQTDIGQALIPLYQAILAQGPALIENLEGLIPPLVELVGILTDISKIGGPVIGFLIDAQAQVYKLGIGVVQTVADVVSSLFDDTPVSFGDVFGVAGIMDTVTTELAKGSKPADVFAAALRTIGVRAELTKVRLDELVTATRASTAEQAKGIQDLLRNRDAAELTATEIVVLERALASLSEELDTGGRANEGYAASMETIRRLGPPTTEALLSQADVLTILRTEADLLGISLSELLAGGAAQFPELAGLIGQLAPATAGLGVAADNLATFAATFETTNVRISNAIDEFGKLPEKLDITKNQFLANLTISATEEAKFQANLLRLFDIAPALATRLQEGGPQNRALVEQFLNDTFSAERAEAILTGNAEDITGVFTDAVAQAIEDSDLNLTGAEALRKFLEGFGTTAISEAAVAQLEIELQRLLSKMSFQLAIDQFAITGSGSSLGLNGVIGGPPSLSGVVVNNTINNPTITDVNTAIAQANQSTSAVATTLNRIVNN